MTITGIKQTIVDYILIFALISLWMLAGSLAFEDEVAQHDINCASATLTHDDNLNCEGE